MWPSKTLINLYVLVAFGELYIRVLLLGRAAHVLPPQEYYKQAFIQIHFFSLQSLRHHGLSNEANEMQEINRNTP